MIRRGSCSKKLKIWLRIRRTVRGKGRRKDSALCFSPGRSLGAPVCLSVCLSWRGGVRPEDWSKEVSFCFCACFPHPSELMPTAPNQTGFRDARMSASSPYFFPTSYRLGLGPPRLPQRRAELGKEPSVCPACFLGTFRALRQVGRGW